MATRRRWLPAIAALGALALIVALLVRGSPQRLPPDEGVTGAGQEATSSIDADALRQLNELPQVAVRLRERLATQPDDAQGWALLARTYAKLGLHVQARDAFATAVRLRADDAGVLADYADTLAFLNKRSFEGEPARLLEQALRLDPRNHGALMLAGLAAFDRRDFAVAIRHWEQVVHSAGADTPLGKQAQAAIDEARKRM